MEKPASCERLQSSLTPGSVPADSMSRPTLQQGQSRAISQAYSAFTSAPAAEAAVVVAQAASRARTPHFQRHAPREEGLDNDAVNCQRGGRGVGEVMSAAAGTATLQVMDSAKEAQVCGGFTFISWRASPRL